MYDSNELDSFRYAQMQSSILNKTGLSTSSSSASKVNLKNKFGSIELTMNTIESYLRKLVADTNVPSFSCLGVNAVRQAARHRCC